MGVLKVPFKKRPNKIRATVTLPIPGRVGEYMQLIRAHDGKTGWTATRSAGAQETIKTKLDEAGAASLLADASVLPKLLQLWQKNKPLKLVGHSVFEGEEAYIIELDDENSETRHRFYLDAESYRTVAHEIHSPTETVLNKLSAYEAHRGVYLATHSEITTETTGRSIMRTESIEIGVGIYTEYFSQTP